jgi:hypothetical protein
MKDFLLPLAKTDYQQHNNNRGALEQKSGLGVSDCYNIVSMCYKSITGVGAILAPEARP